MKKVTYSKQKLNSKIIDHFEQIGRFEYSESKYDSKEIKTKFDFEFIDVDINDNGKYLFQITYDLDCVKALNKDETYVYLVDYNNDLIEEFELKIKPVNYNPEKENLRSILAQIKYKQDKTDQENEQSSKAIYDTNDWLNENM